MGSENANRRFIFETTRRLEVPIDETKLHEYLALPKDQETGEVNEEILVRGLEESIYNGDTTVDNLAEALTADDEFDRLGEYGLDIQVEVRCQDHDQWYPEKYGCMYCRRPELWAQLEAGREAVRERRLHGEG